VKVNNKNNNTIFAIRELTDLPLLRQQWKSPIGLGANVILVLPGNERNTTTTGCTKVVKQEYGNCSSNV
jgi:hypothetical protein